MNLEDLPEVVFTKIFSYLSYDQVAKCRAVSRTFNATCSRILNRGYTLAERYHNKSLKAIKAKLPRRESERKNHPLSRQCDILTAVENRLSMLSMTYNKYVDAQQCCFIPGKVIDEIFRILRLVNSNVPPPKPHDVLQELRDISSMAMEHFDEKILPQLKEKMPIFRRTFPWYNFPGASGIQQRTFPRNFVTHEKLHKAISRTRIRCNANTQQVSSLTVTLKRLCHKCVFHQQQMKRQAHKIKFLSKRVKDLQRCVEELNGSVKDLSAGLSRARDPDSSLTDSPLANDEANMKRKTSAQMSTAPEKKKKLYEDSYI